MRVGDSDRLNSTIYPLDATNKKLIWSNSNPEIVEVDENDNKTAKVAGTAIITVTPECGGFTDSCEVNVSN